MKNALSIILVYCFLALNTTNAIGQDIHFSQLSQTQLFTNPAFAGIGFGPRAFVHYRSQYPRIGNSVNSGFNTYYVAGDIFFQDYHSGVSLQLIGDRFGESAFSRNHIALQYAFQARFNEYKALRLGICGNMTLQNLDRNQLVFFDQIDPYTGLNPQLMTHENILDHYSQSYFNVDLGAVYFTNEFYAGVSIRNLLPKSTFYTVSKQILEDATISGQVGGVLWLNEDLRTAIFPYMLYERQYGYDKIVGNLIYQYNIMNVGIGGRYSGSNLESILLIAGINFNHIRVSYSYDIQANSMSGYSGGAHEIGLRFLLHGEDNSLYPNEHKNILFCPDFLRN